jgi:hypothetical protein
MDRITRAGKLAHHPVGEEEQLSRIQDAAASRTEVGGIPGSAAAQVDRLNRKPSGWRARTCISVPTARDSISSPPWHCRNSRASFELRAAKTCGDQTGTSGHALDSETIHPVSAQQPPSRARSADRRCACR